MLEKQHYYEQDELSHMSLSPLNRFRKIVATGFTEEQVEAIMEYVHESRDRDFSKLSTKEQVTQLEHKFELSEQKTEDRFIALDQKIDQLDQKMDRLYNELDQKMDRLYNELDQKIDRLDQKMDRLYNELDQKIDRLDQKVDRIHSELLEKIEDSKHLIIAMIEERFSKHEAQMKTWMITMFITIIGLILTIAGIGITIILKMN